MKILLIAFYIFLPLLGGNGWGYDGQWHVYNDDSSVIWSIDIASQSLEWTDENENFTLALSNVDRDGFLILTDDGKPFYWINITSRPDNCRLTLDITAFDFDGNQSEPTQFEADCIVG